MAIVLAYAGVYRLGLQERITEILSPAGYYHEQEHLPVAQSPMLYAVGQGAIAIECRQSDTETLRLLAPLNDERTRLCVEAERSLLRRLEGGCSVPIGVYSRFSQTQTDQLILSSLVSSLDGSRRVEREASARVNDVIEAQQLGNHVAELLLEGGCAEILSQIKQAS